MRMLLIGRAGRIGTARSRMVATIALAAAAFPAAALAQVPDEFLGRWSSDPNICEEESGDADILIVTKSGFDVYEIGCDLKRPDGSSDAVRFDAQCYKGGSPVTPGTVVMRRLAPEKIDVSLRGFFWNSEKPEVFYRCHV